MITPPFIAKLKRLVPKRGRLERRAFRRLTPGHMTPCQIRRSGDQINHEGWVHNISLRGAGLLVGQEFPPATRLHLLLVNTAHTFALSVEMDVTRCFRVVSGDWFVGGQLTRKLSHDELMPFII